MANTNSQLIGEIEHELGLQYSERQERSEGKFGPEDIFYYSYAVFHSSAYRESYGERARADSARLPVISDKALFWELVHLGSALVSLHRLDEEHLARTVPARATSSVSFVEGSNGKYVGSLSRHRCYDEGRVYLDTSRPENSSYFKGIPAAVWNFESGGFQLLRKWLHDRRETPDQPGVTLTNDDIEHYKKLLVAIQQTIRIMGEIDEAIRARGGWPLDKGETGDADVET